MSRPDDNAPTQPAVGSPLDGGVRRRGAEIDPVEWVRHADECVRCHKYKATDGVTPWFDGRLKPARVGWYERLFTDGVTRHFWDAYAWSSLAGGKPHWRQVGDYPCWRGLSTPNVAIEPQAR